ncbi:MAG TPA: hypothetical protein VGQ83_37460 [Polyangia bacterium]
MLKLIGFALGAALGLFLVHRMLESTELYATNFAIDAIKVGAWTEARQKFFESSAAWKLALGFALGGAAGTAIQYYVEHQLHMTKG